MAAAIILSITLVCCIYVMILTVRDPKFGKDAHAAAAANDSFKPARAILPWGYCVCELFKCKFNSAYERKLEYKYKQLGFADGSRDMLRAHIAQKVSMLAATVLFVEMLACTVKLDAAFAIFAAGLPVLVSFAQDRQVDTTVKRRRDMIRLEFPVFLNKLVLLCGAGMNILPAVVKICDDVKSPTYLYIELKKVLREISAGRSYAEAFEHFSVRCGVLEVNTFVSLLIQNLRKGNDSLIPVLRLLADTCWEKRRNAARKTGEEMSTKLIFPTMLIFIAILIIIMTPAFLQMSAV